jgi:hypothetical protein
MPNQKRVLYLRVEVTAPDACDPMQSLSDVALWAECQLSSADVTAQVTAYSSAQDLTLDESVVEAAL